MGQILGFKGEDSIESNPSGGTVLSLNIVVI